MYDMSNCDNANPVLVASHWLFKSRGINNGHNGIPISFGVCAVDMLMVNVLFR